MNTLNKRTNTLNKRTKKSVHPSNNLINEVKRLMKTNNSKNNGIKKITRKLRRDHPEWNNRDITEGKVRQAKQILSLKRKRKVKKHRQIPSLGLLRRVTKSLKGPHAKAALELAVHPSKGLPRYSTLPEPPPSRFANNYSYY